MSQYIISLGTALSEVLEQAGAAQPAQFCGYWSNIGFWLSEFEHFVSITNGYEERLRAMRDAHDRYLQEHGGPHNLDELGQPYQTAVATTRRGDRKRMIGRTRAAILRMAQRALQMRLIDSAEHDDLADRLNSVAAPSGGHSTASGHSEITEGPPALS